MNQTLKLDAQQIIDTCDEKNYYSMQVGSSNCGEIYANVFGFDIREVDCGPMEHAKVYDYKGNLMKRDLKLELVFFTDENSEIGLSADWWDNGDFVNIIKKELELNLKHQFNV